MKLIPQPQHVDLQNGHFLLSYWHRITLDASCPIGCLESARLIEREVKDLSGLELMIDRRSADPRPGILLQLDQTLEAEAYRLEVSPEGILLAGGSEQGLCWAVQTLRQLLRVHGCRIPCVEIRDWPDLKARGLFYDVTRGRIPTLEHLKSLADKCSFYKLNQLHLYIEHCFLFDGFSEVWRDDTPLTAEDILELDAYCRKRHVELVPSVATLGHLYKVLRGKKYGHLSEMEEGDRDFSFYGRMEHHTLDVTQEESLQLVFRMIDAYASLFTSRLFNINGDEVFDLGKGRGKALADQIGSHQMYVDWIGKIANHVKELGFRPMFWGDVIIEDPSQMAQLPADIICMNWDYDPKYRDDHARALAATGVAQYLCPGMQGWNKMINHYNDAYRNLHKMATLAHTFGGEGFLVTEWGDYGHMQDPESSFSLIPYAGAMGWNREIPEKEVLDAAASVIEYGDPSGVLYSIFTELSEQAVMTWGDAVVYSEIARGRMPEHDLPEFHENYGTRIRERLQHCEQHQMGIDQCRERLAERLCTVRERTRLAPFFIMSEGQKLLNRYALHLYGTLAEPGVLAEDLESWFQVYKHLWKKTSRESELYRLGEVIFWMADTLRQGR